MQATSDRQTNANKQIDKTNIKVVSRFRPPNEMEKQLPNKPENGIFFPDESSVEITIKECPEKYTLDRIFRPTATQQEVFEFLGQQIVDDVLNGFNGTIFAYGQSGSGKTHTMMGEIYTEELQGIIPRSVSAIFEQVENTEIDVEITLRASMLEIHKERLSDLLICEENDNVSLQIKESPHRGIYCEGLNEEYVTSRKELFELLEVGNSNRHISATNLNKQSSRSHSIFILEVA